MRTTTKLRVVCLAVCFVLATGYVWAQENNEAGKQAAIDTAAARAQGGPFYHLDFVVKDVDGNKVINSRSYSTSIQNGHNSIRAGARVPVPIGTYNTGSSMAGQFQFQLLDVGANFDCGDAKEVEGKLQLRVKAELSSFVEQPGAVKAQPVVRQNKWDADVIVPLGKPTTIFSSDDVSSKSKIQVELTATLIK